MNPNVPFCLYKCVYLLNVSSHLQGMFNRTIRLLEAGIKPVYVFDGQPPDLKKQELAKRYSKREDATKDLNAAVEVRINFGFFFYSIC